MSIKVTIALAAAIVLSSTIVAAAQSPYYYGYGPVGRGTLRSSGLPPPRSDFPANAGGGSVGYNEDVMTDN